MPKENYARFVVALFGLHKHRAHIIDQILTDTDVVTINSVLQTLGGRSREIVLGYFGLLGYQRQTLCALGTQQSISASRVGNVRDKALRGLVKSHDLHALVERMVAVGLKSHTLLRQFEEVTMIANAKRLRSMVDEGTQDVCGVSVDALCLSLRTRRALQAMGVQTVGQLAKKSKMELLQSPYFGRVSLNEVEAALAVFQISLKAYK